METTIPRKKRKRRRRIILLSIIGVFVIFRLVLPSLVLRYVNNRLSNLKEYYGHVEDIDIHLYRGDYVIKNIKIIKRNKATKDSIPFFTSEKIDFSIGWKGFFKGSDVGEVLLTKPIINFVRGAHKNEDLKADTADFRKLFDALMPLKINNFEIKQGELHYLDRTISSKLDINMQNINAKGTNLSNVKGLVSEMPAKLIGSGDAYDGKFSLNLKFNPKAIKPTFYINTKMRGMNLVLLNDFLRAYADFDVKKGNLDVYAEFEAQDGSFNGYVKPILTDLKIIQWNKEEGNLSQILWESLIGLGAEVFQNQIRGELSTKIPVRGTFKNPKSKTLEAVLSMIKNGFIFSIKPTMNDGIDVSKNKAEKSSRKKESITKRQNKKDIRRKKRIEKN